MTDFSSLPYITAHLPGTGGVIRSRAEDFRVEEIPSYPPAGEGDHVFVRIEKTGIDTAGAIRDIARALSIDPRGIGAAGRKDRHAVAVQVLSLPPPLTPEAISDLKLPGIRVLEAARHPHKLRTGHLRGNRFTLNVRDAICDDAPSRAEVILKALALPPGCPNWFGRQRFGNQGDNAARGRELLARAAEGRKSRGQANRFLVSAYQSYLFNEVLAQRMKDGPLGRVVPGDVLAKRDSGGLFVSENVEEDQQRADRGEVVATGPMFGHKMKQCADAAKMREDALLEAEGISLESFRPLGKLAMGTRRHLFVLPGRPAVRPLEGRDFQVSFELPSGSYATAVLYEVLKTDFPA